VASAVGHPIHPPSIASWTSQAHKRAHQRGISAIITHTTSSMGILSFAYHHTNWTWTQYSSYGPLLKLGSSKGDPQDIHLAKERFAPITPADWSRRCHIIKIEAKYFKLEHTADKQLQGLTINPNNSNSETTTWALSA